MKSIGETGLGIFEVAYLAHFADTSAFQLAVERWTGAKSGECCRRYNEAPRESRAVGASLPPS